MIGRFIELGVPTDDILASIGFYESLGFRQLPTGDMWRHAYAVVSDGEMQIGLHATELPGPLLTFVLPDVASHIVELRSRGLQLESRRTGDDEFNEVVMRDVDGHRLRLVEARTFSPASFDDESLSACGRFAEIALPVRDLEPAQAGWERLGFASGTETDAVYRHLPMTGAGTRIGLHETRALRAPAVAFIGPDADRFERLGLAPELDPDLDEQARLRTPEGLELLIGRG